MKFKKGISIIIPCYKGEKYINKLLDSLNNQTIDKKLFEVILIINGEQDKSPEISETYIKNHPKLNITLDYSDKGPGKARNKGIKLANREYSIFIDNDDYISEKYLETLYKYAKKDRIVIGTFYNIDMKGSIVDDIYLSEPIIKTSGIIEDPYSSVYYIGILTVTMDKLIPTKLIKDTLFNPELNNGEDIGYFAEFYAKNDLEIYIINENEEAIYYRLLTPNSVSRQELSYEFNVTARLKVINDINKALKISKTTERKIFIQSLTGGQVTLINQYLDKNPEDYEKVLEDINEYAFDFFPFKYLNEKEELNKENNTLVISYTSPPANTTTGNTIAKRILDEKQNVDIIYATNDSLSKDYKFKEILNEFLIREYIIEMDYSNEWESIKKFADEGMKKINIKYENINSTAFFCHSHFLALEYKLKNPNTYWKAEFSDPLICDSKKQPLSKEINDNEYVTRMNKILEEKGYPLIKESDTINFICEYLTYIFADEIVFTNENQAEVMITQFPHKLNIEEKTTILNHPIIDDKYYYVVKNDYEVDNNYINFAYFGVCYSNRTLENFIEGLDNLDEKYKDKFRLHLFTPNKIMFEQVLSENIYEKTIINSTIGYLGFLNLCKKFDVLLVEDSQNEGYFIKNPYIPSKIWDYIGSKTDIWAVCDEDGLMKNINEIKYKSKINNIKSSKETANKIMCDKLNIELNKHTTDFNNEEINIYLKKRITDLSRKIYELVEVVETEFKKDEEYFKEITALKNELDLMKNSNSWKYTEKFRKLRRRK